MTNKVGVVGAGILGRLIALFLHQRKYQVHLFDQGEMLPRQGCSLTAAGMLSPFCELEHSHPIIARLGMESFKLWDEITDFLGEEVSYSKDGTLVVSHSQDKGELLRLQEMIKKDFDPEKVYKVVAAKDYENIPFEQGLFFPNEGQIDPIELFQSLNQKLIPNISGVHFHTKVTNVSPHKISLKQTSYTFDWVIDVRGLEAGVEGLRSVRGELMLVWAPEVKLHRPIRLMHPRYPIYIAPRRGNRYLIGATSLESNCREPITIRSTLELLSAAYSLQSGFSEAHVVESRVGLRPCFSDNLPKIYYENGYICATGLYRHGYLISPQIAKLVVDFIQNGSVPEDREQIFGRVK